MIKILRLTGNMAAAKPTLRILRNTLGEATFNARFDRAVAGGYRAILARDGDSDLGCLGYRFTHDVFWGKTLFVDDLVVAPAARGQSIGGQLLAEAKNIATENACDHLRLCSGLTREDAHRFYESHDLTRSSYQFTHALAAGAR
ncbi:MAG: GNAT family N-acetyltransferase [Silicimonas sp.]|nr:GNAT family N-acetyltransferase [Silicimonas sp.]